MIPAKFDVKLVLCLVIVAIVWGTTYLGISIAVHEIPAWYVAGSRQVIAASILGIYLWYKGMLAWKGWTYTGRQILLSLLMIVIANGMTTYAEKSIPSGLTSLLNALSPLLVFIGSVFLGMQKATIRSIFGILLGFLGVAFIFRDGLTDLLNPAYRIGLLCIGIAISGWSIGTLVVKKNFNKFKSDSVLSDLFYQFTFAAIFQLILALIFDPIPAIHNWSLKSILAVFYLGIFGSVIGYFCYHYALKRVSAIQVSILSYVNTIIALFLGWLILAEKLSYDLIIATILILLGVFLTNYKKRNV
ncbi:MAG: permease [Pedobacter sp.]|nr:MAG: permease [Pedobacter sp.]